MKTGRLGPITALGRRWIPALAFVLGAAGCGAAGADPAQGTPAPPPSSAAPSPSARPMAKMPAGTQVPLIHKGQVNICPIFGGSLLINGSDGARQPASMPGPVSTGFDIVMLTLIGQRLSAVPIVDGDLEPAEILSYDALGHRYCDVIAGAETATPRLGDASTPYFKVAPALLSLRSAPYTSLAALTGKRVAVISGSPLADYLNTYNQQHGNSIHVATNVTDSNEFSYLLQEKEVDAVLATNDVALHMATKSDYLRAASISGPVWKIVFLVRHGNKALLAQINAALADAASNGQYAKEYSDWFGTAPTWLPGQP